jgi:hypothetical protein
MKIFLRIVTSIVALVVIVGTVAYIDGTTLPLNHSTTIAGTVMAPPDQVFSRIIDIADGSRWRPEVKSVKTLPSAGGRDHWVEDLGHGQTMTFLATRTKSPWHREVLLDVPGATYGGTWTYDLAPGRNSGSTTLQIAETGFIQPPVYRFVMHHVLGMTYNLDTYMKNIQHSFRS